MNLYQFKDLLMVGHVKCIRLCECSVQRCRCQDLISFDFKKHTVISSTVIQFILHFPSPVGALGFREYAQRNALATILKWRSYDGVVEASVIGTYSIPLSDTHLSDNKTHMDYEV